MARIVLRCCCGSSVEMRGWPAPDLEAEGWLKVHFLCAAAWQRERGLATKITYPENPDTEGED